MAESPSSRFDHLWEAAQGGDATAQLALGRHYLAASDFGRARRWLGRAGRGGEAVAYTELGRMALQGLGVAPDAHAARDFFSRAAAAGDAPAIYEQALLAFRQAADPSASLDGLADAARAGHAPALREVAMQLRHDRPGDALEVFKLAAQRGDARAASALALCHGEGLHAPADPLLASAWASRAQQLGSYCRDRFPPVAGAPSPEPPAGWDHPGLGPGDIPTPRAPARTPDPADRPLGDDRVQTFDGILDPLECEYLIEYAAPRLLPSHTVHPETGEAVRNELRTSHGYSLHPTEEGFVVLLAKWRLAAQTGYPVSHAEPFAMLRYEPGQEYRAHYDYIDPGSGEAGREIGRSGQREVTIFAYLSNVAAGGETRFPRHGLSVEPRRGRALMFRNTRRDGRPDADSLHASLPVADGEKWIATLWVRGREFSP